MRRAAKIDANQPAIVADLVRHGCSVRSLASVGDGCPDILVGFRGSNFLFEIKDPANPPSKRKLRPEQDKFFAMWSGQVHKIEYAAEALEIMGVNSVTLVPVIGKIS